MLTIFAKYCLYVWVWILVIYLLGAERIGCKDTSVPRELGASAVHLNYFPFSFWGTCPFTRIVNFAELRGQSNNTKLRAGTLYPARRLSPGGKNTYKNFIRNVAAPKYPCTQLSRHPVGMAPKWPAPKWRWRVVPFRNICALCNFKTNVLGVIIFCS